MDAEEKSIQYSDDDKENATSYWRKGPVMRVLHYGVYPDDCMRKNLDGGEESVTLSEIIQFVDEDKEEYELSFKGEDSEREEPIFRFETWGEQGPF